MLCLLGARWDAPTDLTGKRGTLVLPLLHLVLKQQEDLQTGTVALSQQEAEAWCSHRGAAGRTDNPDLVQDG